MKLVRLTKNNLRIGIRIGHLCFTSKKDRKELNFWYSEYLAKNFKKSLPHLEYFIAYENEKPVGITGLYNLGKPKEYWLGWFGIIPGQRKKKLGSKMLKETIVVSKKYGCKLFRSWTTNKKASKFYIKNSFKKGKKEKLFMYKGKKHLYSGRAIFFYKRV